MNIEQLRDSGWIVYETLTGSHAYGTNMEGSDRDYKGIYIQPTLDVLVNYIPQVSDEQNDTTFYEIGRFIELFAKGNPNVIEMMFTTLDCVVYKDPYLEKLFTKEVLEQFITTRLRHSFSGFAYAQIKKSKGLNKKVNWDAKKMVRKDPLDFCYVIGEKEDTYASLRNHSSFEYSCKFKDWVEDIKGLVDYRPPEPMPIDGPVSHKDIGLAKVNNAPTLYSMYYLGKDRGGIIRSDGESNQLQLREIPKEVAKLFFLGYMSYDQDAYSTHCKDYLSYQKWLEERNPQRYDHIKGHGQGYDGKNLNHTIRLLNMALDIGNGKGVIVRRSPEEIEYLLNIRKGEVDLSKIHGQADNIIKQIDDAFDNSGLPKKVNPKLVKSLLSQIRKDYWQ